MALMQISEPGQSLEPHQKKKVVGIDLGTSNSLVATLRSGVATVIGEPGDEIVPSVVRYQEDGAVITGKDALRNADQNSANTFFSIKRFMGKAYSDFENSHLPYEIIAEGNSLVFKTPQGNKSAVEISSEILKALKERAEASFGLEDSDSLDACVITVPAYFDEAQRQATLMAARLAGLEVLRLLNEPTAAAVAYGLDESRSSAHYLVYDLGGGTFDVSLLHLSKGVFEVLATGGDSALGGDDFDKKIYSHILESLSCDERALSSSSQRYLLSTSKQAKQLLTHQESVEIEVEGRDEFEPSKIKLDKSVFESLIEDDVRRTIRICKRVLKDAGLKVGDVDEVILVGGSTRVPAVKEAVETLFEKESRCSIDPDLVVALGAARQADVLAGNQSDASLLLDVTPLSLGLETMGGLVEKIIDRNTAIPISRAQEFTTYQDGQTAMSVHVVQGERDRVEDCRSLARFELRGIPPMVAGAARVKVTFQVDADGLLTVSAMEENSGVHAQVEVKPSFGLSADKIESMLKESFEHAEFDMKSRSLKEEQVEAERMILALKVALEKDGAKFLDKDEVNSLRGKMEALENAMAEEDVKKLRKSIDDLNRESELFAGRRMDDSVVKALGGKHIDQIESKAGN